MKDEEDTVQHKAAELALGRIFGMLMRPTQPGDVEEYERCRCLVLDACDPLVPDWRPNWIRDRLNGAAGQ